jgi:hypothetical protein
MSEINKTRRTDILIFLVSTVIMGGLLYAAPAWFWVPLPFVLTYLTKAFNAI